MLAFPFYFTAVFTQIYNLYGTNTSIAISSGETFITLDWPITDLNAAYSVSYSLSNFTDFKTDNVSNPADNQTELQHRIENLYPGEQYLVRLLKDGAAIFSQYVNTRPLPPYDLITTDVTTGTINVTWKPAQDSIQDQYKLYVTGQTESTFLFISDNVTQTWYNIANLRPGFIYRISVQAFSNGEPSNQSTSLTTNTVPLPPASVTVTALNGNKLNVSWEPDQNSNQDNYKVSYSYVDSVTGNELVGNVSCPVTPKFCVLTMTAVYGQIYTVRLYSLMTSEVSAASTERQYSTKPLPITNLREEVANDSTIHIKWTAPLNTFVHSYIIYIEGDQGTINQTISGQKTEMILTDLQLGSQYNVTVTVTTGYENSEPVFKAFYTYPVAINSLTTNSESDITTDSVTVYWTVSANATFDHFLLTISPKPESTISPVTVEANVFTATFSGLLAGNEYIITIQTQLAYQLSNPFSRTFRARPNAPTSINTTAVSSSEIHVQWTPPTGRVDNYIVTLTPVTDANEKTQNVTLTGTSHNFVELEPGHEYNIKVVSQSGGLVSESVMQSIITNPMSVPEMTVSEVGSYTMTVNWTQPTDTTFDDFFLTISPAHTDTPIIISRNEAVLTHQFNSLTAGQLYTITIVTRKSGVSSDSLVVRQITKPLPVQNLNIIGYNTSAIHVSWTVDSRSQQSHFTVGYQELPVGTIVELPLVMAGQSQTDYNLYIEGLFPGGNYRVSVQAWQDASGESVASDLQESTGTTQPRPVNGLTSVPESDTGMVIDWSAPEDSIQDHYSVWHRANIRDNSATWIKNSTLKTNLTLLNLFPGEQYEIRVFAVSKETYSEAKIIYIIVAPRPTTDAIALPNITTEESISLQWSYNKNVTFVESWTVGYVTPLGEQKNKIVPRSNESTVTVAIDGLTAGYQYQFIITSHVSEVMSIPVTVVAVTKPLISTSLTDGGATNSSVTVRYTVESKDYFDAFIFRLITPPREILKNKSDNSWSVTFTDLDSGALYTVEVQTISIDQHSDVKQIILQTLPNKAIVEYQVTSHNITLQISKPAGEVDSYRVECSNAMAVNIKNVTLTATEQAQTVDVTNLNPHNLYTCKVITIVKFQVNIWSRDIYTEQAPPSAVIGLQSLETAPNQVTLSWQVPQDINGELTAYVITYTGSLEGKPDDVGGRNVSNTDYLVVFIDLKAGYEYIFKVWAKTIELGEVSSSTIVLQTYVPSYKAGITPEKAMPSVADEKVVPPTSTSLFVNFTNAFSDSNGEITQYTVIITTDPDSTDNQNHHVLPAWKNAQLDPSVKTYQAVDNCSDFFSAISTCDGRFRVHKRAADVLEYKVFELGSETDCENKVYCNGPLKPNTVYYVLLRVYNLGHYRDTPFSGPIKTAAVPVDDEGSNVGGIVAGVLVPIILIIVIVIVVLCVLRRMRQRKSNMYRHQPDQRLTPKSSIRRHKSSCPVAIPDFKDHVRHMSADSDFKYAEQFEDLKDIGRSQPCSAAELPCNRGKNRFTNILPYDHSRVKLLPIDDEEGSDYINANYVPGYTSKREYVVTQGPLPSTRDDFWRMLWEQNSRNVVMLTKCTEKGREKCDHYWPTGSDAVFYGDLQVAVLNETLFPDWTITEFRISLGDQSRQIRHFHFTAWPDFGVPKVPQTLVRFVRTVRDKMFKEIGPVIVHCSAGVGRSGTFIVIDRLLQTIETGANIDIFSIVAELRKERVWMVQTEQQYICIHECLLCVIEGREDEHIYDNVGHANPAFDDDEGVGLN